MAGVRAVGTMGRVSAILLIVMVGVACGQGIPEDVVLEDLTEQVAVGEILGMQKRGFSLVDLDVEVGKEPTFTLTFSAKAGCPQFEFSLAADQANTIRELDRANARGGMRFQTLKGYNPGKTEVRFAFLVHVFEEGRDPQERRFIDVPLDKVREVVEREAAAGGKLFKESTYDAPDGNTYKTLVFRPLRRPLGGTCQ